MHDLNTLAELSIADKGFKDFIKFLEQSPACLSLRRITNVTHQPWAGVSHLGYSMALFGIKIRVTFGFGVCVL